MLLSEVYWAAWPWQARSAVLSVTPVSSLSAPLMDFVEDCIMIELQNGFGRYQIDAARFLKLLEGLKMKMGREELKR